MMKGSAQAGPFFVAISPILSSLRAGARSNFRRLPRGFASRVQLCFAVPFALAACGPKATPQSNIDSLDAELAGNATGNSGDPAVRAALQDQIMVDPALAGQSNNDAIRPPLLSFLG